jgi:hypothetical protein
MSLQLAYTFVIWGISLLIFTLYYKSGVQKMRNPYAFVQVIDQYQVLSLKRTRLIAPLITVLELVAAVWVLLPWTRMFGAVLGAGLQLVFLVLMIKNLGRTFPYGCGCFELNAPKTITDKHVLFNIGILSCMLVLIFLIH